MLEKFSDKLLAQLKGEIAVITARETDAFKRLSAVLKLIRSALKELKDFILEHPFKTIKDQIYFFKHIKPLFYSLRIFYLERYDMETGIPPGDKEDQKKFYKGELKTIQRFFQHIYFHYQYYRLGASELDELYFVRGIEVDSVLVPEMPELDPEFSTACDYLFSKIRAFELLQDYVLKRLNDLGPSSGPAPEDPSDKPVLKWTGDKVNLVEVIYALYFTGQLNNGNADISLIIQFMERYFQIDLSRAYRDFIDIRKRKVVSPTKYIDQMRDSIYKRIDDDLAFKPNKMRYQSAH